MSSGRGDYKKLNVRMDCVYDKPLKALRDVGEVEVLIEVEIASVSES
jgi:hypothetical protein